MSKHIAIKWAQSVIRQKPFIYSDKFFQPFVNVSTRRKITNELAKSGITVWSDTKDGAFIIQSNDSRLTVRSADGVKVGVWVDKSNNTVIMLPAVPV